MCTLGLPEPFPQGLWSIPKRSFWAACSPQGGREPHGSGPKAWREFPVPERGSSILPVPGKAELTVVGDCSKPKEGLALALGRWPECLRLALGGLCRCERGAGQEASRAPRELSQGQ